MPLTPADELDDLLWQIRQEIARYRYPNRLDKLESPTRKTIEDAASLRLAGRSWGDIEEDFEYRGVPVHLSGRLKKQICQRAEQLKHVEYLRALSNENDDNA